MLGTDTPNSWWDEGVRAETSASGLKKKKRSKKTKGRATDEVPPEESASLDATSEGLAEGRVGALVEAAPDGSPKKRTKWYVEAETRPSTSDTNAADTTLVDVVGEDSGTPENLSEERRKTSSREEGSGDEPVANERSAPDSSARKSSRPEGSLAKKRRIKFPDREMPQLEDLYFRDEYIDAASSRARSDGSMNFLVEKYDSHLKQTMIQLGSSEKLAQARLKAIESVRAEHKKANEKAAEEKEILRVKFEELEVEKLIRERQRLKDSRGLEVTRERERVEAAMVEKANRCFGRVRDHFTRVRGHFTRLDAFRKAKNLYGQASGTKKCLEIIKASGTEIPQEMIDVFAEQEKLHEAEATKLCVGPLSDSDLTLSPLVFPSRFVEDRFRASFDPYGLNHVEVPEGGGLEERPENENLEEVPEKDNLEIGDIPVREEETENVGIEDAVLVSDSSSEGREDEEEEDDRAEETSPPQPVEEETTNEVGDRNVPTPPPPPTVDSLVPVPTRVEDPAAAATEDLVGPPTLGTPEEDDQDYVP
ncbi:hypothetical protein DY000_02018526 [Brassica cretica]|uniref:Uncharacterized protein n=1 Tax=Brassica cretica TaxID=69181 RepID=A0ABQ7D4N6_BRACR|nr:hypothetical protein DY000_02018526 [Brassica cretica]